MISLLLLSHGSFADGVKQSLNRFYGESVQIDACCLLNEDDPKHFCDRILQIYRLNQPFEGMLILTDLEEGVTVDCAAHVAKLFGDVRVVTGLNLKMALEACTLRGKLDVNTLARRIADAATASIRILP